MKAFSVETLDKALLEFKENTDLLCLFRKSLQNVGLPGVVAIGVLKSLQNALSQDQHRDPELVPEKLHCMDVHNHIDRVGQQL
jgi:hypothetical protein